ncbi:phage minor capsid protein [Streptomyces sp. NPDC002644]
MPVSPAMAEDLAAAVAELYDNASLAILEMLRRALAEGIDSPLWLELKARSIGDLREAVEEVIEALRGTASAAVAQALTQAYTIGQQAAVAELGALAVGAELVAREQLPGARAVDRLAASFAEDTRPLYERITREVLDVYRQVITPTAAGPLLGIETRRQASQRALDDFARRGVTGFRDSAGRRWELASYAEMAVRSVTARAAIEGHTDSLQAAGLDLVVVSAAPLECDRCKPWEGKVLSLSGPSGPHTVEVEHATRDGEMVTVRVAGTLEEARADHLFHPNCRHSTSAYLPGVTRRPKPEPTPGTTYADTQRQRDIERTIRAWKRRETAALDEQARLRASRKVREWQARARANVAAHDDIKRKPAREQIGAAR